jgi:AGZA family xanthine/uracil permease-like MFS transporter
VLAGVTTFMTMAYIVVVNPAILGEAGMPVAAVAAATCLAAGFGSILMGLIANYPLALAPGMGLNAYFTYTVVKGMGVPWETALGCVFLSGVAFLVLTLVGVRQMIVAAIPKPLFSAVAAGVGLFIAFIGLKEAGIIVANPATTVALGDLTTPTAAGGDPGPGPDRRAAGLAGQGRDPDRHPAGGRRRLGPGSGQDRARDLQPGRPDRHGFKMDIPAPST